MATVSNNWHQRRRPIKSPGRLAKCWGEFTSQLAAPRIFNQAATGVNGQFLVAVSGQVKVPTSSYVSTDC
jgi:hypothetical protein